MENILYIVIITLIAVIFLNTLWFKLKMRKATRVLAQMVIDNKILKDALEKELENRVHPSQDVDGLIKFLSDSRDSAFSYIELSQSTVKSFVDEVGPFIKYFDEYNVVMPTVYDDGIKKISQKIKSLEELLPKEDIGEDKNGVE